MTIKGRTHRCDIVNLSFLIKKERILNRTLTIYTKLKRGRYLHLETVTVNALSALLFNICIEYVIRKDLWDTGRISIARKDYTASTYKQSIYSSIKVCWYNECKCSPSSVSREVESGKCKCARMIGAREARRRGGQRCSRHVVKVNVLVGRRLDVPIALLP